jgi:hypothetical protein
VSVSTHDPSGAVGRVDPVAPERTPADRFMRRLLRVGDTVDKNAIFGARRSTTASIVVSGIRCTITYLLIPFLTPFVGLLETIGAPLSLALCLFAMVMGVAGVRRFWIADHRSRWAYTAFIGVVLVLLSVAVVMDIRTIVSG